ncbi:protease inhibitor I42 family protein [Chloroflexota bacterium]
MKLRILALFIIVALTFPVLSCIVTSRDTHVEISCDDFMDNPTSIRNDFEIEIGDKLYVELCSNPTTGFEWSYEMSGDTTVKEEDHDFDTPGSDAPGTPGKENWTFEGVNEGITEILMEYSQPWDDGIKQEWTYKITITVK